ncbi:ABC transporter permease [Tunicatimonas pelagia]|uniref:ABC transporter permease n=1 Tax=Tunicatimonas pelagia TaxID=931531 RepID=UPI002666F84F|nr:ABC transporter permease [Tunicatimonas pelagia]WKN44246.1 ABC transporter permease [Tunicatimonas pelagia]
MSGTNNYIIPPKWPLKFLRFLLKEEYLEEIEGDMEERFRDNLELFSANKARRLYAWDTLKLLRPTLMRGLRGYYRVNHTAMLKSYFTVAWRNLLKQKAYSTLNIMGLCLGIACVLLIAIHLNDELSYESSFPKHECIYRVSFEGWAKSAPPMAEILAEFYPEIQQTARFYYMYPRILRYKEFQSEEDHGYMADSTAFSVFDFKLVQGDPQQIFRTPHSMVVTESMARKYFGDENPLGKVLMNNSTEFQVTGVVEDLPSNTHLRINFLVSMATFYKDIPENMTDSRGWMATYTYALFNEQKDVKKARERLPELLLDYYKEWGTPEEILAKMNWTFMPLDDIHLHSSLIQEMGPNSDIIYIYVFAAIGLFILLIASINFINIFTTQSLKRMKEVGIRRAIGAKKNQLLGQFLGEAFMVTLMASTLAILLFTLVLPFYNQLAGKQIVASQAFSVDNLLIIVGIILTVGLLSGLYPAFFVSGFSPLKALAGAKKPRSSAGIMRKGLLVFQFVVAVFMVVSTLVVYQQMQYFHDKKLGFDKDQVVAVNLFGDLKQKFAENGAALKAELIQSLNISHIGTASNLPGDGLSVESVVPDGVPEDNELPTVKVLRVDENYLSTLQIELKEGRNFSRQFNDSAAFIINETAAKLLNIDDPVGSYVTNQTRNLHGPIVGVIKDYHFSSLHNPMEPLVLEYNPNWNNFLLVKLQGGKIPETISGLEANIQKIVPNYLFNYQFLDDRINLLYQDEAKMSTLFKFFALFAIMIACLGLFGLSAHASEIRTKEVAIRKAIGATITQVVQLLSREFIVLVMIGNLVAWPLAWWAMNQWLDNFTYHVAIHWGVFAVASGLSLLVALLTVSYHAIKTALANPVDSLRNE